MCKNYDCKFSADVAEPEVRVAQKAIGFMIHQGGLHGLGYRGKAAILMPRKGTARRLEVGIAIAIHALGDVMSVTLTPSVINNVTLYKPRDFQARGINGPIVSSNDALFGERSAQEQGMRTLLDNKHQALVARETLVESRYKTTLQPEEFKLQKNDDGHWFGYVGVILNDDTGHAQYHIFDTTIPGVTDGKVSEGLQYTLPELQGRFRFVLLGALGIEDEQTYTYQDFNTYSQAAKGDDEGNAADDDEMPAELKALIDKLVSDHPDVQVSAHKINLGKTPQRRSMTDKAIQDTMNTLVKNPEAVADAMRRSLEVRAKLGDQAGARAFSDTMMHLLYDDEMGAATVTELLAAVDSGNFDKVKEAFAAKQAAHS